MGGILIVDDRSESRGKTTRELVRYGYPVRTLCDAADADKEIGTFAPDMVLINRQPDSFDSIALFLTLREKYPHIPVLLYVLKSQTALKSLNQAIAMAFRERKKAAA